MFDIESDKDDGALSELIRALAVAGFAASNIMLLSVSIWSGADAETRRPVPLVVRDALRCRRWPIPAGYSSGRPGEPLRHGRTNMDVPISIGVLLAFGMSVYETVQHGPHAYFDAAISLLFFLLIGRTLDHMMRERARQAVRGLARLAARGAFVVQADGTQSLSSGRGDRARHERYARRRRTRAGRCDREQGRFRARRFAGLRRERAAACGRGIAGARGYAEPDRSADAGRDGDGRTIHSSPKWCG